MADDGAATPVAVALNGYGSWNYGKTNNENLYLNATEVGSYSAAEVHLSVAATLNEHLRIVTQVGWKDGEQGSDVQSDYIFADWSVTPELHARIGKVKMPFGIYSEIPNVGTLRPLLYLPQAAYGPVGFLGESYKAWGFPAAPAPAGSCSGTSMAGAPSSRRTWCRSST